ncbi:MAG: ABC transporter ATP-binding protein [Acidimicrobiia bacterium]
MSLELRDIHKHFGPVRANDGVSLTIESGTLHGLLGENGAGKSTLMKILSGFYAPDAGEIILDGERIQPSSPRDAIAHGIGMLHQDPLVFLPMSVVDNLLLASPGRVVIDRREARRELAGMSERFGFDLDPGSLVRSLTVGERQQLEIIRLLWLGARVLVLDEPTTGISAPQRVKLFSTLRGLAAEGMSVIFVSHKLEEVEEICERVTVMRSGRVAGHLEMPSPAEQLVEMMFGEAIEIKGRSSIDLGGPLLAIENLTVHERLLSIEDLNLNVKAGEVIGLAGLEGSGQRTLLRACAGLQQAAGGSIMLADRVVTNQPYAAGLEEGIQYLPAGRLEEGLITGLTLTEHLILSEPDTPFFVDWGAEEKKASSTIAGNFIKGRPSSTAEELSGGNQQRLLLAMLRPVLRLLLLEHPTRGLDIESANWVWSQLLTRREHGTAIMFASADLDELLRYSNRILVFFAGRVIAEVNVDETDVEELGFLIGGMVKESP